MRPFFKQVVTLTVKLFQWVDTNDELFYIPQHGERPAVPDFQERSIKKQMMWKLLNQENLYMKRKRGRRGLKSQKWNYRKTKVCVACYIK